MSGGTESRWAVVGGGLMGLTLALRFAQAGRPVTLIEAAPEIGGLAAAWSLDGVVWDKHYHVTLLSDRFTRGILQELGLEAGMRWVETRTGFYARGQVHSLSNAVDYLRLPALGLVGKLRLAATIMYAARVQDWRRLEGIPVETWLRRCSGDAVFERLWRPLLRSKLGEGYRSASAAFIWATIQRLYAARRTGLKKEMFGYVPGGYATVLARFAEVLREKGATLCTGCAVERIEAADGGLRITAGGCTRRFARVVVTVTPSQAARMCTALPESERAALPEIQYQGVVCAAVLLKQRLSDYYLTYLADGDWPFTAVVDMSAFVGAEQLGGCGLVYLPRYAHASDPVFQRSDSEIQSDFFAGLRRAYPQFRVEDVRCCRISRVREVFPLPALDYSRRLPAPATSVPGLHIVNSAHIVNGTLNVNDTVRVAETAARELLASDGLRVVLNQERAA